MKNLLPFFLLASIYIFSCELDLTPDIEPPKACFSATPEECIVDDCTITFDASCSERAAIYRWDFEGDGIVDVEGTNKDEVSFSFTSAGMKTIKLTVESQGGITDNTTRTISVLEPEVFDLKIFSGNDQSGILQNPLEKFVVVRLVNQKGESPQQPIQIDFTVLTGGGSITESVLTEVGTGIAEATWILGNECGEQTAKAVINQEGTNIQVGVTMVGLRASADAILYREEVYPIVVIGGQCWMAKNLNCTTPNSWCYEDNSANCSSYGRLYTWDAARQICPSGWHIPSREDWNNLIWQFDDDWGGGYGSTNVAYSPLIEGGVSGFGALLGGQGNSNGFSGLEVYGKYWSSWECCSVHMFAYIWENGAIRTRDTYKTLGLSCRCIKD